MEGWKGGGHKRRTTWRGCRKGLNRSPPFLDTKHTYSQACKRLIIVRVNGKRSARRGSNTWPRRASTVVHSAEDLPSQAECRLGCSHEREDYSQTPPRSSSKKRLHRLLLYGRR